MTAIGGPPRLSDAAWRKREQRRRLLEAAGRDYRDRDPYGLPHLDGDAVDLSWRTQAACLTAGLPTGLFFPPRGDWKSLASARQVCSGCPVRTDCRDFAVRTRQHGVWGGTTEKERRRLRRVLDPTEMAS